jgi:hypothetical protein
MRYDLSWVHELVLEIKSASKSLTIDLSEMRKLPSFSAIFQKLSNTSKACLVSPIKKLATAKATQLRRLLAPD